jgi:hypothetical protein
MKQPLLGNGSASIYESNNSTVTIGYNNNGTPTDTNAAVTQQQRNGVFCVVRAETLQAGQVESGVLFSQWSGASWLVSELLQFSRCELLLLEAGS